MSIDQARFRQVMGHFTSGVTVVTMAVGGDLDGITVSSFCALSLSPPLVLICIGKENDSHPILQQAEMYAVNVLAADQEEVSRRFAMRETEKFPRDSYVLSTWGLPLLNGALAQLECRVVNQFSGGDHTIFVGEVLEANVNEGRPLLYYRGGYQQLAP
jgi:flavin reductase (DIM6/NTAB) family NADH-FMN oxidoreductase RutF